MSKKPFILVCNDDGYDAPGIIELASRMKNIGDVVIAAPDRQRSAVSSSLSVAKPLRVKKYNKNGIEIYSVDGTPTDTAKLAIHQLLDRKPDLLVSGINHGANTSVNVLYSGTVAAAIEGMLADIPSIAFSLASHSYEADINPAGKYAEIIASQILKTSVPKGTVLNVNIPAIPNDEILGIKITHLSNSKWIDKYDRRYDPFNREYFWFAGEYVIYEDNTEDADDVSLSNGYVSVSPIKFDFSDKHFIEKLKKIAIFK